MQTFECIVSQGRSVCHQPVNAHCTYCCFITKTGHPTSITPCPWPVRRHGSLCVGRAVWQQPVDVDRADERHFPHHYGAGGTPGSGGQFVVPGPGAHADLHGGCLAAAAGPGSREQVGGQGAALGDERDHGGSGNPDREQPGGWRDSRAHDRATFRICTVRSRRWPCPTCAMSPICWR